MQSSRLELAPPEPSRIQVGASVFVTVCFVLLAANTAWVAIYSSVVVSQRLLSVAFLGGSLVATKSSAIIAAREIQIRRSNR